MLTTKEGNTFLSLPNRVFTSAEQQIISAEMELRKNNLIARNERLSVSIFDLKSDSWLLSKPDNHDCQTGSMIKMIFAFAAVLKFPDLFNTQSSDSLALRELLNKMLVQSDNSAANQVLKQIGGPDAAQSVLLDNFPQIFSSVSIKDYIPESGKQYENTCSPEDCVRGLRALWKKDFPSSAELMQLLSISRRSRLVGSFTDYIVPTTTGLIHKTGSTSRVCCESAIIIPDQFDRPYIISAIIDSRLEAFHCEGWLCLKEKALGRISAATYKLISELQNSTQSAQ